MLKKPLPYLKSSVKFMSIISLLLPCLTIESIAQDFLDPILISEVEPKNIYWTTDGETLLFQEATWVATEENLINPQSGEWFNYHIDEQGNWDLTESSARPQVLQSINSRFFYPPQAVTRYGQPSFLFPSPNNRYIAYATEQSRGQYNNQFSLAIADLETGQYHILEDVLVNFSTFNMLGDYEIRWSANSQALIITSSAMGPVTTHYYVNLGNSDTLPVTINFENTYFNNQQINIMMLLDISSNGNQVLTDAYIAGERHLFIWDAAQPAQSVVTDTSPTGSIYGGAFSPIEEGEIYYIDHQGLTIYNLITRESQLLNSEINSVRFTFTYFSPNGNLIALYERNTRHIYLHIINE